MKVSATMLRERFSISEQDVENGDGKRLHISAQSSRISLKLQSGTLPEEHIIIRTKNMHSCTRMAAKIAHEYDKRGPTIHRNPPLNWDTIWNLATSPYERHYCPDLWVCLYHEGKPIFSLGSHHPFLDVIEKCDHLNQEDYDKSISLAEDAFRKAGKNVKIEYDSNVAYVANIDPLQARCGMILRSPERTTTFSFAVKTTPKDPVQIPQAIAVSAAFLEGVQLSYMIGINHEKLRIGMIEKFSDEEKQTREARQRLSLLDAEINSMENRYKMRFRPDRPIFHDIITQAEHLAQRLFGDEYIV